MTNSNLCCIIPIKGKTLRTQNSFVCVCEGFFFVFFKCLDLGLEDLLMGYLGYESLVDYFELKPDMV